ncbi:rCG49677 [Rattus norvegicus]|uniref:RCG49677 n=1 Tax=Rattus norvegicus TaxID=10116 RepID=A6K2N6_RAT|nr:rCG49677 [Rattus norvegicus]
MAYWEDWKMFIGGLSWDTTKFSRTTFPNLVTL